MDSRRLTVDVTGDVAGLKFNLVHHWKKLPSYPPPYFDRANYDIWEPYWVSARVGFILFLNRGVSPHRVGAVAHRDRRHELDEDWPLERMREATSTRISPAARCCSRTRTTASSRRAPLSTSACCAPATAARLGQVIDLPNTSKPGWPVMNGIADGAELREDRRRPLDRLRTGEHGHLHGFGSPVTMTIWETADAGATWAIKRTGGSRTTPAARAVDADKSGNAVLFATPYAWGGAMHRELRSTTGVWSHGRRQQHHHQLGLRHRGPADGRRRSLGACGRTMARAAPGSSRARTTGRRSPRSTTPCRSTWTSCRSTRALAPAGGPMYSPPTTAASPGSSSPTAVESAATATTSGPSTP